MRHKLVVFFFFILLFSLCGCGKTSTDVALLPLDSRPPNTTDAVAFAELCDKNILLPEEALLDDFYEKGDTAGLMQWLSAREADEYIIFTNELFCGGLMASRNLDNYKNLDQQIKSLQDMLANDPDAHITVVTVLPRLAPSEYDAILAPYSQQLNAWNQGKFAEPLPDEVLGRYKALFSANEDLVKKVALLKEKGFIDDYIIALDDYHEKGLPIDTWNKLAKAFGEELLFTKGADELTMMLLAKGVYAESDAPAVAVDYTNLEAKDDVPLYEGQALSKTISEKLAFLGCDEVKNGDYKLLVHNDRSASDGVNGYLEKEVNGNVALADVTYTNKGDASLWPLLQNPPSHLKAYAGWNTAGNSIGTALAWLMVAEDQTHAAQKHFWALRLAQDQVYLAHLKADLKEKAYAKGWIDERERFLSAEAEAAAQIALDEAFQNMWPESQLPQGHLSYPWGRIFEVRFTPDA